MFEKLLIPKKVLGFMCDKMVDFFSNLVNNRISEDSQKNISVTEKEFERYFRNKLQDISDKVDNLEAVVYHEKILFNKVLEKMISDKYLINIENLVINQPIYILINIGESTYGDTKSFPEDSLSDFIMQVADDLFVCDENDVISNNKSNYKNTIKQLKPSQAIKEILEKRNKKLKQYEVDNK